ncbi:hypothetical protein [Klebsiella pneumoniae]|uniref:hypothetical protein n=1 Tax=Klebsiella pneumoniae TaxID=573 RepID=UPI003A4DA92B
MKDMSGILTPHAAFELVSEIKKRYDVTLHLHCHATTGMAEMALLKAIEAGVDGVDTAISSMTPMAREALVHPPHAVRHRPDIHRLEIAAYFREVRIPRLKASWAPSRISSPVPGGSHQP